MKYTPASSIKSRFRVWIVALYGITSVLALGIFFLIIDSRIADMGEEITRQYSQREKERILLPVRREVALCTQMAQSPLLQRWADNENDPQLRRDALIELEAYRRTLKDSSYFFAIRESGNYWFGAGGEGENPGSVAYTMHPDSGKDSWFYSTLETVETFDMNVNYDEVLGVTNLWINAVIRDGGRKLGVAGTGLTLDAFIDDLVSNSNKAVTSVLIDRAGAIRVHPEKELIDRNTIAKPVNEISTFYNLLERPADRRRLAGTLGALAGSPDSVATLTLGMNGSAKRVSIAYMPEIEWYVLSFIDLNEVIAVADFIPVGAVLIVSLFLFLLVVTILINRYVLNPVSRLAATAKGISGGDFDYRVRIERTDEIGVLTETFNRMVEEIGEYTRALEEHRNELEDRVKARTADLEKALAEVKTLSGLLPICSHCKKIRDDGGYWNMVEVFITEHSDARFSHGICPECMEKHYPDIPKKKKS